MKKNSQMLTLLGFAMAMGSTTKDVFEIGNPYGGYPSKKPNRRRSYKPKEPSLLSPFTYKVNGKTKTVYATDSNQADEKARKNKWI